MSVHQELTLPSKKGKPFWEVILGQDYLALVRPGWPVRTNGYSGNKKCCFLVEVALKLVCFPSLFPFLAVDIMLKEACVEEDIP
jgi:hypothetical protein